VPDPLPPLYFGGSSAAGPAAAYTGSHTEVADRIEEYAKLGITEFVLSGYPHLEEAYWFGEGVLPILQSRGLWSHPVRPDLRRRRQAGGIVTRVAVVTGNPKRASRTQGVALAVADALGATDKLVVDLAEYAPRLFDWSDAELNELTASVAEADISIFASPTYKASFTGLLKAFLDRYGSDGLAGTIAVPVMTGGWPGHLLSVEVHLRPVLVELGASVPSRGLYVTEPEFASLDAAVGKWAETAVPLITRAASLLAARPQHAAPAGDLMRPCSGLQRIREPADEGKVLSGLSVTRTRFSMRAAASIARSLCTRSSVSDTTARPSTPRAVSQAGGWHWTQTGRGAPRRKPGVRRARGRREAGPHHVAHCPKHRDGRPG
jgi:FMN reductase